MLNPTSYEASIVLADALANNKIILKPKVNTLLSELVGYSSIPDLELMELNEPSDLTTAVVSKTTGTLLDPTFHDRTLGGAVDDLSKIVASHLSFAKNVVKPIVVEYVELLREYNDNNKPLSPSATFNIVVKNTPELVTDASFLDLLKAYEDKPILKPSSYVKFNPVSDERLLELLQTGNNRINDLISGWALALDPGFLQSVWDTHFNIISKNKGVELSSANIYARIDYALAIYLLSSKLFEEISETTDNLSLIQYQNMVVQLQEYGGSLLLANLTQIKNLISAKTLIVELNSYKKYAVVAGEVYTPWLEGVGKPETILGLITSNANYRTTYNIDKESEALLKSWETFVSFYTSASANKELQLFKEEALDILLRMKLTEDEEAFRLKNPAYAEACLTASKEYIRNLKFTCYKDPFDIGLELIAKYRFGFTSAYKILMDIHQAGEVNPNIDAREAALIATINYMTDYFIDQISYG